jgi:hypothetical protein
MPVAEVVVLLWLWSIADRDHGSWINDQSPIADGRWSAVVGDGSA